MSEHPMKLVFASVNMVGKALDENCVQRLITILEQGQIRLDATAGQIQHHLHCSAGVARKIITMLRVWRDTDQDERRLADTLQAVWYTQEAMRAEIPVISLVWTGPEHLSGLVRTTIGVLLDLIEGAHEEIIILNYALSDRSELVVRLVEQLIEAQKRGVQVVIIGDKMEGKKARVLEQRWPDQLEKPVLYTRPEDPADKMSALHAKAILVDGRRLLTTSANLSYHGLVANVEMGLLVEGEVAQEARRAVMALIEKGVCVRVGER